MRRKRALWFFGLSILAGVADYFFGTTITDGINIQFAVDPLTIGAITAIAAPSIIGAFKKKKTTKQVPLQTPEEAQARNMLLNLGRFGTLDGLRLGEDIGIQTGDYDLSPMELEAISGFQSRMGAGIPSILEQAIGVTSDFLQDPTIDPAGQFAPFKSRVEREIRDRSDDLKRHAAFGGSLFNTKTIEGLGDVQARGTEALAGNLAGLTNQAIDRQFSAAQFAPTLAGLVEEIERGRLLDALGVGGLPRQLENSRIGAENQELLRRRGEEMGRVDALGTILKTPTQFGVPEITTPVRSPFQNTLDLVANLGGTYLGNRMALNQAKSLFPTAQGGN